MWYMQTPIENLETGSFIVVTHRQDNAKMGKNASDFGKSTFLIDKQGMRSGKILLNLPRNAEYPGSIDLSLEGEMQVSFYG